MKIHYKGSIIEVKEKKTFEYNGVSMAVHRPVVETSWWLVSEVKTGLRVGWGGATIQKAIDRAKSEIDEATKLGFNPKEIVDKILKELGGV